jgi:hypothetical protein
VRKTGLAVVVIAIGAAFPKSGGDELADTNKELDQLYHDSTVDLTIRDIDPRTSQMTVSARLMLDGASDSVHEDDLGILAIR